MSAVAATQYDAGVVGPKQPVQVLLSGDYFYLTVASGPLYIKPSGGSWVLYYSGMGTHVPGGFTTIQVYNPTANAVTFQLVSGSGDFIDQRQVYNTAAPSIVKTVGVYRSPNTTNWSAASGNASVVLQDWSGKQFLDNALNPWLAVQRVAIVMQLLLEGVGNGSNIIFYNGTSAGSNQNATLIEIPAVAEGGTILPPYIFSGAGDFSAFTDNVGGNGQVYVSVFEIYQAVQPNSLAYQPPN